MSQTAMVETRGPTAERPSLLRSVSFTVPGEPRGKGRPRFGRSRAGHPVAYTDSKTVQYESLVRLAAHQAWVGPPTSAPVTMNAEIRLSVPASATKKQRAAMLAEQAFPMRIDLDNVIKAVADGCNGVVFVDDRQIIALSASKRYSETPGVDVTIREVGRCT